MNRRPIAWLVTGVSTVLVVCTLLAHDQLARVFASQSQAAASHPCNAATSDQLSGEIVRAQTVGAVTIGLTAAPDPFGNYTFIVTAQDANCAPLRGAKIDVVLTMPDMQMAPLRLVLSPVGPAAPGSYLGQGVLSAGRWQALVRVLAQGATQPVQAAFPFSA
jgi:hypothetical protein